MPLIHDILALDLLTLQAHTERAGDVIDAVPHRARLQDMLETCSVCPVHRAGRLVAYAALAPESANCWFVRGFNTHPSHRTSSVMGELLSKLSELACQREIVELRSHVYKTNLLSIAFHRKLGFHVTRENEKAVEFFAAVSTIRERRPVQRAAGRIHTSFSPPETSFRESDPLHAAFESARDDSWEDCPAPPMGPHDGKARVE